MLNFIKHLKCINFCCLSYVFLNGVKKKTKNEYTLEELVYDFL